MGKILSYVFRKNVYKTVFLCYNIIRTARSPVDGCKVVQRRFTRRLLGFAAWTFLPFY